MNEKQPKCDWRCDWIGPVLVVAGGLMAVVVLMTVAAAVFQRLGIADRDQAMALPGGSVGAIIAISLVMLFAILAVLFHSQIAAGGDQISANDFAKQAMTVAGVLVTSVASFFFGAKTATSAADQATKAANQSANSSGAPPPSAPNPASVKPPTYPAAGPSPVTLTVMGQNLNAVVNAQVSRQGSDPVPLTGVASNATQVSGQLPLSAAMAGAPWDIVIDDGAGNTGRLPAAFTVTAGPATGAADPPSAPNPTSVEPAISSAAGPSPVTLTISGQNLNPIVNMQLSRAGSYSVSITRVASNATQVSGQLALSAAMAGAPWDVVIDDGAGTTATLPAAFTITP